jgi:hypothetical protein
VKQIWSKAVAIGAVCAAGLAGGVVSGDTARGAAAPTGKHALTPFGYKANVFGTKVLVDGVEVKTVKDALAQQKCTRVLRGDIVKGSTLGTDNIIPASVPVASLIHVSPSTSSTQTYKTGQGVYGVLGTNTIADIVVGGVFQGVQTPVLKIAGLKSTSNAWNDTTARGGDGVFDSAADFGFGGISLQLNGPAGTEELQDLLDIIQSNLPITEVVTQIVDLLEQVGVIEIPGLGSLALGKSVARHGAHSASANAYALKITVQPPGTGATVLQLGRAYSRITDGVPSGVFRSTMSALDLSVGDVLQFGNVSTQTIPCEGTSGQVKSKSVAAASVPGLVSLSGVTYSWRGKQLDKGKAKGFVQSQIGKAEIPSVGLVINGVTSRVDLRSKGPNEEVKRKVTAAVGSITLNGVPIPVPGPGQSTAFQGGVLQFQKVQNSNYNGTEVRALVITLFDQNVVLSLGEAAGRIFYR